MHCTCGLTLSPVPPGRFLVLISVRDCADSRAIVQLKGLGKLGRGVCVYIYIYIYMVLCLQTTHADHLNNVFLTLGASCITH
jgi:hypothetical protein